MSESLLKKALDQIRSETGLEVSNRVMEQLHTHAALIRQWNTVVGLVSKGDLACIEACHIMDSLSLVPLLCRYAGPNSVLLDIGAGAGFPSLPIHCVLPTLSISIVERNVKKVGFLHKAVAALALPSVTVLHGSFPSVPESIQADFVTARAVERPGQFIPALLQRLPQGSTFLCQTAAPSMKNPELFHVEQIHDTWDYLGWRRGALYRITRR